MYLKLSRFLDNTAKLYFVMYFGLIILISRNVPWQRKRLIIPEYVICPPSNVKDFKVCWDLVHIIFVRTLDISPTSSVSKCDLSLMSKGINPDGMLGTLSSLRFSKPMDNICHILVFTLHSLSRVNISIRSLEFFNSRNVQSHLKLAKINYTKSMWIHHNTIYEYIIQFWFAYLSKQNDVIRLYLQLCATISLSNFPLSKPLNSIPLKGWQYFVTCCVRECCSLESRSI